MITFPKAGFFPRLIFKLCFGYCLNRKFFPGQVITPLAEGPFGEFHDIAFMNQGDTVFLAPQGVFDGPANQTLAARTTDRFDPDPGIVVQSFSGLVRDPFSKFIGFRTSSRPFNPGVDILGIFPEDDHIHLFRMAHGAGNSGKITDRPETDIEVQDLSELNVEASNPFSHRRGQRAFQSQSILTNSVQGFLRQPVSCQ